VRQHCAACPLQDVNHDVIAEKVRDLEQLDKPVQTSSYPGLSRSARERRAAWLETRRSHR
jgi:hypothetical protein